MHSLETNHPRQPRLRALAQGRGAFGAFVASVGLAYPAAAGEASPEDQALTEAADLPTLLRLARERSPDLAEARARREAALARTPGARGLPAPEIKYEQWGTPLSRPWSLQRSDMIMLGVRQQLPPWGLRAAEEERVKAEAGAAVEDERARLQELLARVRQAHARYFVAGEELRAHRAHAELTARLVETARAVYGSGGGAQQDVLRLSLELSRVHAELAGMEQELRAARGLLNALAGRPPGAPLGSATVAELPALPALEELEDGLAKRRADLATATRLEERGRAALEAARRQARIPTFMLGLDYQHAPMEERHGYGAMVSMTLPWLSGKGAAAVAEAEATLRAEGQAAAAARQAARQQVLEAHAAAVAARRGLEVLDRDVLPQAERSLEVARGAYASGGGEALGLLDALRSTLQLRIERVRALGRVLSTTAELDRVSGRSDS
jgi:outer membrane protein TolC